MTTTPILAATDLVAAQAIPETSVNETVRRVEQGGQYFNVKDKDLATPPGSPAEGDAYIVAASPTGAWAGKSKNIAYYQTGTGWLFIVPRTGFRAYVADEDADYRYVAAAWSLATTAGGATLDTDGTLAANSDTRIATQKATKTYVDGKVAGLSWKIAVRAATTANGTLATAFENGDTIDGVVLATGDRILIKNQAAAAENGIYTVNASGAPTRATDADSSAELVNASVYVSEGTTLADTQWTCSTNAPITVNTTALVFAQLTSAGGALQATNNLSDVADPATAGANIRPVESLIIACSDEATAITTGTAKVTFRMPYAFTLTGVRASVNTAPTGSTILIDINESGTTILSTKLMIDATEKTSTTATTPAVISDASLADDAEITVDFDQVGSTISGKGVKIALIGRRT